MNGYDKFKFWIEPRSWALPLRIGAMGDFAKFEIQIGPFGMAWR